MLFYYNFRKHFLDFSCFLPWCREENTETLANSVGFCFLITQWSKTVICKEWTIPMLLCRGKLEN